MVIKFVLSQLHPVKLPQILIFMSQDFLCDNPIENTIVGINPLEAPSRLAPIRVHISGRGRGSGSIARVPRVLLFLKTYVFLTKYQQIIGKTGVFVEETKVCSPFLGENQGGGWKIFERPPNWAYREKSQSEKKGMSFWRDRQPPTRNHHFVFHWWMIHNKHEMSKNAWTWWTCSK